MPQDVIAHAVAVPLRVIPEPRRRARRRTGLMSVLSSLLLAGVVLAILVAIGGMLLGAWRFTVISTGSMRPRLNPGDVAVLTSEPTADLRRGEIVAFHPPGEPQLTVIHRVFSLQRTKGTVVIRTKGDANSTPDAWRARISAGEVWREDFKLPALGYLAVLSHKPAVRLGILLVVVIVGVSLPLSRIWRRESG